ncbi:MAG: hypothetical protein RXR32_03345 [Candidatus Micrarchaeota archaeon]
MGAGGSEKVKENHSLLNSHFEKFIRDALISEGIPAIYEPIPFPIHMDGKENTRAYLPDFVTSIFVNGKPVVLEVHAFVEIEIALREKDERKKKADLKKAEYFVEKIGEFRKSYGTYVVIISSMPESTVNKMLGLKIRDFVDEYWFLEYNRDPDGDGNHYKLKNLLDQLEELKEKGEVKNKDTLLETLLEKLKEKGVVKNEEELLDIFDSKFIENVEEVEDRKKKAALRMARRDSERGYAFKVVRRKE